MAYMSGTVQSFLPITLTSSQIASSTITMRYQFNLDTSTVTVLQSVPAQAVTLNGQTIVVWNIPDNTLVIPPGAIDFIGSGQAITATNQTFIGSQFTVDIPPTPSNIPVALDCRNYLEDYNVDTNVLSDAWITNKMMYDIIPSVQAMCWQNFSGTTSVIEYYSGNGTSIMMLNHYPLLTLDSVSYTNVIADQYTIQIGAIQTVPDEGILKARTNFNESTWYPIFTKGTYNLRIGYTYGYATMPTLIKQGVIYKTCSAMLKLIGARTGGGPVVMKDFSRPWGTEGMFTDIIVQLEKDAYRCISPYFNGLISQ